MQSFIERVRTSLNKFMEGRYGTDQLGLGLIAAALVFSILGMFAWRWANVVSLVLLAVVIYRMLSTNIAARQHENDAALALLAKPVSAVRRRLTMWENSDTKAYVRCPHCHTQFALPKGRGRLRATCPKCGEKSEHTV